MQWPFQRTHTPQPHDLYMVDGRMHEVVKRAREGSTAWVVLEDVETRRGTQRPVSQVTEWIK